MSMLPADIHRTTLAERLRHRQALDGKDSLAARRRRGVIVTTVVASLIAATFYVGFIVMMVLRAIHP